MKEKIALFPPSCEMATALFDTGAGSGLTLGSSAAWRVEAKRRQS
jgi:hypothetical protein